MRVTVCQMGNGPKSDDSEWDALAAHVRKKSSNFVLLPEMPFYSWFPALLPYDPVTWQTALKAHDAWQKRLNELAPAVVMGSRPINLKGIRNNQGFVWKQSKGYCGIHEKCYLPDEDGFWEASWYDRGKGDFTSFTVENVKIGFLICTELWFMQHARSYGKAGVHLVVCPRATPYGSLDRWLAGGRAAAIISGAFCLSSNREFTSGSEAIEGQGWIIGPEGDVLAQTSSYEPFVTIDIDPDEADQAKLTYPRYVESESG